jgi:hypothetical protein
MSAGPAPSVQLPKGAIRFGVPDGSCFLPKANSLDIYLDEQWPGTFDSERGSEAIVTAIVTGSGAAPILPKIPNHIFQAVPAATGRPSANPSDRRLLSACDAINALLPKSSVFPVVLQLDTIRDNAQHSREAALGAAFRILLGRLLRGRQEEKVTVRVFLDRDDHKGYGLAYNPAPVFRAFLSQALAADPDQFGTWEVGECAVVDSSREQMMAYADLLGHAVPRSEDTSSAAFAGWARLDEWPGYVRMDESNVPLLFRALPCRVPESAEPILDLVADLEGTAFGGKVLSEIADGIAARPRMKTLLLNTLEQRYRDKNRNIRELNRQYVAVRDHLLTSPRITAPKGAELLTKALEFHYANHLGNPLDPRVQKAAKEYRNGWRALFSENTPLAASVNAKLAIHYCDQFDFVAAQQFLEEVTDPEYFKFLDRRSRGVLLSTRGQVHAMLGQSAPAETAFLMAIQEFGHMDADLGEKEIRQTSVYRAMNLLDSDPLAAKPLIVSLIGKLSPAARRLASAPDSVSAWDHHLLLRAIYLLSKHRDQEAAAARKAYLGVSQATWSTGNTHPWELIDLYRVLMLYTSGEDSHSCELVMQDLLKRAALICRSKDQGKDHGITLHVICAMIDTVAVVTVDDASKPVFKRLARREIATVSGALGKSAYAKHAMNHLESILGNPDGYSAEDALKTLPFNYH